MYGRGPSLAHHQLRRRPWLELQEVYELHGSSHQHGQHIGRERTAPAEVSAASPPCLAHILVRHRA